MNYGFGRLLSKTTIALSVHMVVVVVDDFVDDVDDVDDVVDSHLRPKDGIV